MNRRIVLVGVAAVIVFMLFSMGIAGCNTDQYGSYTVNHEHYKIDGETVRCLLVRTSKGTASLSCDWDNPVEGGK